MMNTLRRYVALVKRKAEIDAELREVKEKIENAEPSVLEYMTENGIQRIAVDDRTLYIRRQFRASYLNTPEAQAAAVALDLGDALTMTIHPSRAAAIVRERLEAIEDPEEEAAERARMEQVFTVYEGFRVGVTR
jgi:hypothetical protein